MCGLCFVVSCGFMRFVCFSVRFSQCCLFCVFVGSCLRVCARVFVCVRSGFFVAVTWCVRCLLGGAFFAVFVFR